MNKSEIHKVTHKFITYESPKTGKLLLKVIKVKVNMCELGTYVIGDDDKHIRLKAKSFNTEKEAIQAVLNDNPEVVYFNVEDCEMWENKHFPEMFVKPYFFTGEKVSRELFDKMKKADNVLNLAITNDIKEIHTLCTGTIKVPSNESKLQITFNNSPPVELNIGDVLMFNSRRNLMTMPEYVFLEQFKRI